MDFKERLCTDYALSEQSAERLLQDAERVRLGARQVVEREGARTAWAYFVEQGAVRTYVERGGRCVLLQFAFEGEAVRPDLPCDGTARSTAETLEPTVLVRIPQAKLAALLEQHAELANWAHRLAAQALRQCEAYFIEYNWMDKGRQYERLLHDYPQLLQRVPLKELAAYLDVTPQTLSRIRARIR